ncbi:alginate lyase family protein [Niastella yeongjuensis]|nr:alginate lyase family protein [Niastella yeongjuensis]
MKSKLLIPGLLCCLLMLLHTAAKALTDTTQLPVTHPSLLLTNAQVNAIKNDIQQGTWKQKAFQSLKKSADKFLEEKLEVPSRGGNWNDYYINPVTYNELKTGKLIGDYRWEHYDERTGQVFLGDLGNVTRDYDGVIISLIHDSWALGALETGIVFQLSGDLKYAGKARDILMAYAALYPTLPARNRRGTDKALSEQGRLHAQDLDDSKWLVDVVQSADLIWNTLTPHEQQVITDSLLLPAARFITTSAKPTIHNIQCWRIAAVGLTGLFTHDEKLIKYALIDSVSCFTSQVSRLFTKEGMILDLSPSYQFFALYPLIMMSQAIQNYGYPVDISSLKRLFTAPLMLSSPYFMLPPIHDSRSVNIRGEAYLYEWGYTQFKDTAFATLLKQYNRSVCRYTGTMFNGFSLIFGETNLPHVNTPLGLDQCVSYPDAGLTKLVTGTGADMLTCFVKYTPKIKRTHFHYAQLDFALLKGLDYISVMPENVNYASPLSVGYYKTSLAHNTYVLNEIVQNPTAGKCLATGTENGIPYAITETTTSDSVHLDRTIALLNKDLVLVVDAFQLNKFNDTTVFDMAYHQLGTWSKKSKGKKWTPPNKPGYQYIKDTYVNKKQTAFKLTTMLSSNKPVTVSGITTTPVDIITGYGLAYMKKDVPLSIFRFKVAKGILAYCISLTGEPVTLKTETIAGDDITNNAYRLTIEPANQPASRITLVINPHKKAIAGLEEPGKKPFVKQE